MGLSKKETEKILEDFYAACLRHWKKEKSNGWNINPEEMALKDIRNLTYDPRSPKGRKLDEETVKTWVIKDGQ